MSRFGWAYVNSAVTGAVANGPTNSIQFNSGSQILSGSPNFTFNPATNTLFLTGTLRADSLIVSSSQIFKSGSTIFGDDVLDTHQFTGSLYNTTLISGTIARFTTITGSLIGTASYASNSDLLDNRDSTTFAGTGSNTFVGNQIITGTLNISSTTSGTTAQFATITGSVITGSGVLLVGGNATIGGSALIGGGFAAKYATFSSNFTASANNHFIGISTTGSVITASLRVATQYVAGQTLIFKDIGGNAGTNNILIAPTGVSDKIDGASGGVLIATNSGSVTLVCDGTSQFYIVATA